MHEREEIKFYHPANGIVDLSPLKGMLAYQGNHVLDEETGTTRHVVAMVPFTPEEASSIPSFLIRDFRVLTNISKELVTLSNTKLKDVPCPEPVVVVKLSLDHLANYVWAVVLKHSQSVYDPKDHFEDVFSADPRDRSNVLTFPSADPNMTMEPAMLNWHPGGIPVPPSAEERIKKAHKEYRRLHDQCFEYIRRIDCVRYQMALFEMLQDLDTSHSHTVATENAQVAEDNLRAMKSFFQLIEVLS